ncbi:MAG: tRNA pseudouridine(55) synthase TruB [Verrucomicrobiota bacterium]
MTDLDGLLLVDKPPQMTSHDIVAYVRKAFGIKKVGHCGTLDPMATGLLMLVLGKATKVQDLLMSEDKFYAGSMMLGKVTDSQDAEGEVLVSNKVPEFSQDTIEEAFDQFKGDFYQTPPMVSAVKKDGVPLYRLARQGKTVARDPRLVHVYKYSILNVNLPQIDFELHCSKGFYVRTYCHDIGEKLQCGAHLCALKRIKSGNFSTEMDKTTNWNTLQENKGDKGFLSEKLFTLPEISNIRRQ